MKNPPSPATLSRTNHTSPSPRGMKLEHGFLQQVRKEKNHDPKIQLTTFTSSKAKSLKKANYHLASKQIQ
jgi:hypothetical protein